MTYHGKIRWRFETDSPNTAQTSSYAIECTSQHKSLIDIEFKRSFVEKLYKELGHRTKIEILYWEVGQVGSIVF